MVYRGGYGMKTPELGANDLSWRAGKNFSTTSYIFDVLKFLLNHDI